MLGLERIPVGPPVDVVADTDQGPGQEVPGVELHARLVLRARRGAAATVADTAATRTNGAAVSPAIRTRNILFIETPSPSGATLLKCGDSFLSPNTPHTSRQ